MDHKALVKIIEACGQNGVESISFHGIEIKFRVESYPNNVVSSSEIPQPHIASGQASSQVADSSLPSETKIMTAEEKTVLEEIRLSQLMIDDPEAFEQLMIDTHLERERSDVLHG